MINQLYNLTKLYKDKDSFYFALYHELGHLKSDYNKAKNKVIVDGDDYLEDKADQFAINIMINSTLWNNIKDKDINEIKKISKTESIPLCFITGRMAKEGIIRYNSKIYNRYREII